MMYVCMSMEAGGKIDFQFPHAVVLRYGFNKNYGAKYIKELCDAGFIELTSSGRNVRQPNLYRFCFQWKSSSQ